MSLMALGFLGADDWDFATWAAEVSQRTNRSLAGRRVVMPDDMVSELKEQGTTILMATHEMSFAHDAADRIVLLRRGVIAENGTPREVMDESRNPETREFFSHFRS